MEKFRKTVSHPPHPGKDNHSHSMDQVLPEFCLRGDEVLIGIPSVIVSPHDGSAPDVGHAPDGHIAFVEVAQELKGQDARPAHRNILPDVEILTYVLKLAAQQTAELVDIILKIKSFR